VGSKTLRRRRSAREEPTDDENSESSGSLETEDPKVRGKPRTEGERASHKPSRFPGWDTLKHTKTARAEKPGLATSLVSFLHCSDLVGRTFTGLVWSLEVPKWGDKTMKAKKNTLKLEILKVKEHSLQVAPQKADKSW
jgi:hypothetical protein